eukprot:gene1996-3884_t
MSSNNQMNQYGDVSNELIFHAKIKDNKHDHNKLRNRKAEGAKYNIHGGLRELPSKLNGNGEGKKGHWLKNSDSTTTGKGAMWVGDIVFVVGSLVVAKGVGVGGLVTLIFSATAKQITHKPTLSLLLTLRTTLGDGLQPTFVSQRHRTISEDHLDDLDSFNLSILHCPSQQNYSVTVQLQKPQAIYQTFNWNPRTQTIITPSTHYATAERNHNPQGFKINKLPSSHSPNIGHTLQSSTLSDHQILSPPTPRLSSPFLNLYAVFNLLNFNNYDDAQPVPSRSMIIGQATSCDNN